jgi:hypothetical protein
VILISSGQQFSGLSFRLVHCLLNRAAGSRTDSVSRLDVSAADFIPPVILFST